VVVAVGKENAEFIKLRFRKTATTIEAGVAFTGIEVFDVSGVAIRALG
jgi:hypothetical protein